jgi:hypothetical protein
LVNEDCSVKICDFGLARSISGVETASCILDGRKFAKDTEGDESKPEDIHKDVLLAGAELSKIHYKDETSETQIAIEGLKIDE